MHVGPYVNGLHGVNYVLMLCFQQVMCQDGGFNIIWGAQKRSGDLFSFIGEGIFPFLI